MANNYTFEPYSLTFKIPIDEWQLMTLNVMYQASIETVLKNELWQHRLESFEMVMRYINGQAKRQRLYLLRQYDKTAQENKAENERTKEE